MQGFDYSQAGAYFVTIVTKNRECLFGEIKRNGNDISYCRLNNYGKIAHTEWLKTAGIRKNILVDEFIIMPNHIHGILIINNVCRGTRHRAPTAHRVPTIEQFGKPTPNTIPTIIRSYKSVMTKQINQLHQPPGLPVWQRNYYEHIIRNENELIKIRKYICDNPLKWEADKENPLNIKYCKNVGANNHSPL